MTELEEHEANGPETWQVVKAAERCWQLRMANGTVLETRKTRHEAQALKVSGYWVSYWAKRSRWMRGENVHPWKPYAQVVAERERNEAAQAQFAAIKAAGYEQAWQDESAPCAGGGHDLPAERPAWTNGDGRLWCRSHLREHWTAQPLTTTGQETRQ